MPTTPPTTACVDVLCAYLQLPFTPDPGDDSAHQEEHHRYLAFRKVRHTILRLIGDHYRRPRGTHRSWQGCDLDLTGVTFDAGLMSFKGAAFAGSTVSFMGATFSDGMVSFNEAVFSDGFVNFAGATFSGGMVSFSKAVLSDRVNFARATFSDGTVYFGSAAFSDGVNFDGARFSNCRVSFNNATGPAPQGLLAALGTPAPAEVVLPASWSPVP
ncbi:pentapeptide repeat-containing protein [Streptomyces pseudogriseolus]|uniref:pentapeptide repeat-containing protein n=1 Tax=Streptomyces pseudogriseolus TaxID=36817 RepID=UPI0034878ED2